MYVYVHTHIYITYGKVHEWICVRRVLIACEETPRKQDKSFCDLSTPRQKFVVGMCFRARSQV